MFCPISLTTLSYHEQVGMGGRIWLISLGRTLLLMHLLASSWSIVLAMNRNQILADKARPPRDKGPQKGTPKARNIYNCPLSRLNLDPRFTKVKLIL